MQKKLIAMAIAGLASTAAFGQTNVTLYGVVDATFETVSAESATAKAAATATTPTYTGANRQSFGRVNSNSSYIGLKGTEDLGDGLKAIFQFETGFNADAGVYSGSGRDTYVGLNSASWGTVKLGQFSGPTRVIGTTLDLLPGRAGLGTSDSVIGRGITNTGATATVFDTRTANTLQYISPTFNGFTVTADYAAGENKNLDTAASNAVADGKIWELGLSYVDGPWYAAYAHGKDDFGTTAATTAPLAAATPNALENWTSDRIGVGYSFAEGHKINVIWDKQQQDIVNTGGVLNRGTDLEKTSWSLQGLYKVSVPGSVILAYTKSNDASGSFLPGTVGATSLKSNADTGAKLITLGYLHTLSKRTTIKAVWSRLKSDDNVNYDFSNGGVTAAGIGLGADPSGIAVGIRHTF